MFVSTATLAGVLFFATTPEARAEEPVDAGPSSVAGVERKPLVGWPVLELRGGIQGVDRGANAMICGELSPIRYLAIEGCGSGAGFLYSGTPTELVHFRAEANIPVHSVGGLDVIAQPGIGFAELEHGGDQPGFLFGEARTPDQTEGAGPELSVSAKARYWPNKRVYLSAEAGMSAAWIPSAPAVLGRGSAGVVSGITTVGIGF